jgi:4-amino-4-deoxy-L-arabinose transferase-like glycosyltransferase
MNFDRDRPTPSRLSAEAAVALPRTALLLLLVAFALPGVFGHDLWPEEASAFGRMWTMAHGTVVDWWFPNVAGQATPQDGPFPFWLGAASIRIFGNSLGDIAASRLSALVWFAAAALAMWAATRRFAASNQAQPIVPAFGREPDTRDYARLLADIAVLIFISTLGILVTLHVPSADTVSVAVVAAALYGLSVVSERPIAGAALAGACAGALALSRGPVLAAGLLAGCDLGLVLCAQSRHSRWLTMGVCTLCALAVAASWPAIVWWQSPHGSGPLADPWLDTLATTHGLLTRGDGTWLLRNGSWYVWPLWPLAAWALYAWRHHLRAAHIAFPASALAGLTLALVGAAPLDESKIVLAIAPLSVLAAFGFPTLRRTLEQWFDWFAMAVYTLFMMFVWAYFWALISGTPRAMAASVARLIPGYTPDTSKLPLVLALAVTGLWIALMLWRVRRRPRVLWRGALLSASGMTALWLIAVCLFLPAVDHNRSYRVLSEQIGRQVPSGQCVSAVGVSPSMRALIAFYGKVRFGRDGAAAPACPMALQPVYRRSGAAPLPFNPAGSWELAWEGRRPVRSDESWRLWRVAPHAN